MNDRKRFHSPEDFSRISGLSLKTVYRRIWDGSLGAVQPGGPRTRWLIPAGALDARPAPAQPTPPAATSGATTTNSARDRLPGPPPRWTRRRGATA